MQVQRRLVAMLVATTTAVVIGLGLTMAQGQRNVARIIELSANNEADQLATLVDLTDDVRSGWVYDNSFWDDAAAFADGPEWDPAWGDENLAVVALGSVGADVVWLLSADGVVRHQAAAPDHTNLASALPPDVVKTLLEPNREHHFFLHHEDGLLEVTSWTVHTSDDPLHAGPVHGALAVAKVWDAALLADVGRAVQGTVTIVSPSEPARESSAYEVVAELDLPGIDAVPVARLRDVERDPLRDEIVRSVQTQVLVLLVGSLALTLALIAGVRQWVMVPLQHVATSLRTQDPRPLAPLRAEASEFGDMARLIVAFFDQSGLLTTELERRKVLETSLTQLAMHDSLTGLPNRVLFWDRLRAALAHAKRSGTRCGVMLMDLDRFKQVNDTRGHHVGDALLIAVANRLNGVIRDVDTAARLGGDEFGVVLMGLRSPDEARLVAERLLEAFRTPFEVLGEPIPMTLSIGVALCTTGDSVAEQLLQLADKAMYEAKSAGRATFRIAGGSANAVQS